MSALAEWPWPELAARKNPVELAARVDLQLLEHLGQVVLDGSGTDEQAGADSGLVSPSTASRATLAS